MPKKSIVVIAEFSIHPIGSGTSVGRYVNAAIKALSKIPKLKHQVTPMATILEAQIYLRFSRPLKYRIGPFGQWERSGSLQFCELTSGSINREP